MSNRVNLSATVPPEVKAAVEGIAELEVNTASRIVEKAIKAYADSYQKAHPDADLVAAAERYQTKNPRSKSA
jgi:predicted transcriptional regulator